MASAPRITPGARRDIGSLNAAIVHVIGKAMGGRPPNVMTTLARHRGLFRRWLFYGAKLMPGGRLPRSESELVILRVAHNTGSAYEWDQHEKIGRLAGLSAEEVERVRQGPAAEGWSPRQALILRAVDELHSGHDLSDETFAALRAELSEVEVIELCLLTGHYVGLAMTLNALRVVPDAPTKPPSGLLRRVTGGRS